jgi:hypothetical protein
LAVSGDASGADPEGVAGLGLTQLRERLAELPSASPWLPYATWKRVAVLLGFWGAILLLAGLVYRPLWLPGPLARLVIPLTTGSEPKLAGFVDITLWLLAAEFAAIIGWYRSHSQLDFFGLYRLWGWVAGTFAVAALCAATGLPQTLATLYADRLTWLTWRRETLAWLVPVMLSGCLAVAWAARDARRCLSARILFHLAGWSGLAYAVGRLYEPEWGCEAWYVPAMLIGRWTGLGLLVTALWRHACYVAYICPDPPARKTGRTAWQVIGGFCAGLFGGWWRRSATIEDVAPKRGRRRKKADGEEDEEPATPRRRRRTTTKKKPTRTRRKAVVEEEEAYESEEDGSGEGWEETEEGSGEESSGGNEEWSEDDELAQLEALTRPDPAPSSNPSNRTNTSNSKSSPAKPSSRTEDEESDGDYGGIDQGHSKDEMFKGLSKRQRRELKRQQRDKSRGDEDE